MVSPSATSPALSTIEDDGFFFRTVASDARQGEILADVVKEKGFDNVAVTFTNNDYGKGFADAFAKAFEAAGGTIAISAAHEDGKGDYSAEVAALQASGAPALVVLGYVDQGGVGIVQASLNSGAFEQFFFGDGMYGQSLIDIDRRRDQRQGYWDPARPLRRGRRQVRRRSPRPPDRTRPAPTCRRATTPRALIALAIAASGSADRTGIRDKMMDVANAPGEKIYAGELAKGLELVAAGTDIDYVRRLWRGADRPRRVRGHLPRLRGQGQRRLDPRLPLIRPRAAGTPAALPSRSAA